MRKLFAVLFFLLFVFQTFARDFKNELSLTYGQATVPQAAYVMGGILGVAFTLGHFTFENTKFVGAPGIEYVHYTNDWFGYGGSVVCDYITSDTYSVPSEGEKTYNGKWNFGYLSLMPEVKFSWFNREKFGMYSKLACGPALVLGNNDSIKDSISIAAQITPFGIDYGASSLRGFLEIGVGMQGLINVGVRKMF